MNARREPSLWPSPVPNHFSCHHDVVTGSDFAIPMLPTGHPVSFLRQSVIKGFAKQALCLTSFPLVFSLILREARDRISV